MKQRRYEEGDIVPQHEIKRVCAAADRKGKTVNFTFARVARNSKRLACVNVSYRG
jgi:hypothetical protein